ncbi:MAG: hypothetical protein AAF741_17350, partial [Bacteroidota bacterium]
MRFYYTATLLFAFAFSTLYAENDCPESSAVPMAVEVGADYMTDPLPCDAFYYVNAGGDFGFYNPDGSTTIISNVGFQLNAAGYSSEDGFIYAVNRGTGQAVRLHNDGTFVVLGTFFPAGGPLGGGMVTGGMDDSGNLYVRSFGGAATIYRLDISTLTLTTINPGTVFGAADWAFHPTFQQFYGVDGGALWTFDPSTNQITSQPLAGLPNGTYPGVWYGANGFIYAINDGDVYKINVETLESQRVADTAAPHNDAASCLNALPPFPFICAEDDEGCAAEGVAATIPVKENDIPNNALINNTTIAIIAFPSFGTITGFDPLTGEPQYTPDGPPMMDQFTYQICPVGFPSGCDIATVNIIPAVDEVTFDDIGPFCAGDPLFSLPQQSLEGINGTWTLTATGIPSPFVFPAFPGNTSYTFVPDNPPGECFRAYEVEIVVAPTEEPEFDIPTQYCQGDAVPALPDMSDNMVSGTWDPATINNQISRVYTFTPDPIFFPCSPTFEL